MKRNVTREMAMKDPNLIVPIAFDIIFKEVFGTKKNIKITEYLVSILLDIPYEEVKGKVDFKEKELSGKKVMSKKGEKDIVFLVSLEEPFKISLEMNQFNIDNPTIVRNSLFQSDSFVTGIEENDNYVDIPITIQFNFNPEFVDIINRPLVDEYYYKNKYGYILTEKNKIVHINVAKMSDMWYNLEYKSYPEISPILFLISAIIIENEKIKFDELISDKRINDEIGKLIEGIVYDMNENVGLVSRYYDYEEERKKLLRSDVIYQSRLRAEKIAPKMAEKMAKELAAKLAKDMAKDMAKDIAKEMANNMAKDMVHDITNDTIRKFYKNGVSLDVIEKSFGISKEEIETILNFPKKEEC